MSNKAITTNDLKAVLDVVLPPQPSEYKKLLWTNPSPTSGFAAQTISLDLSEYDDVEIECLAAAGGVDSVIERCAVGKDIMAQYLSGGNGYGSGTTFLAERKFKTSTSGVEALNGLGNFADSSSWAYNSTSRMIPYRIYGIKYERVYPPQIDAQIVHSNFHGTSTLQCGVAYYNLFSDLEAGIWLIFISYYSNNASGEAVVCYGSSYDNAISENGGGGQSGAGIIELTGTTTIQMYSSANQTLSRFRAEAVKIA